MCPRQILFFFLTKSIRISLSLPFFLAPYNYPLFWSLAYIRNEPLKSAQGKRLCQSFQFDRSNSVSHFEALVLDQTQVCIFLPKLPQARRCRGRINLQALISKVSCYGSPLWNSLTGHTSIFNPGSFKANLKTYFTAVLSVNLYKTMFMIENMYVVQMFNLLVFQVCFFMQALIIRHSAL